VLFACTLGAVNDDWMARVKVVVSLYGLCSFLYNRLAIICDRVESMLSGAQRLLKPSLGALTHLNNPTILNFQKGTNIMSLGHQHTVNG